jgi:hypothetical protein
MAGLGAKLFASFTKLTAADVNGYLADQAIMRFATSTARDAAFGGAGEPTLAEGMTCYLDDTNVLQSYTGSAWVEIASSDGKAPRGLVSFAQVTTATGLTTTEAVQITAPAFTAVANRYYRVTYYEPLIQIGAATPTFLAFRVRLTNLAGTVQALSEPEPMPNPSDGQIVVVQFVTTFTAGSTVLVATAATGSSTASAYGAATTRRQLIVEDIGAV